MKYTFSGYIYFFQLNVQILYLWFVSKSSMYLEKECSAIKLRSASLMGKFWLLQG